MPLLSGKKANIWMQGSASRIGTDSWNTTPSQVRVGSVLQFLADNGATLEQIQSNAIGEQDAKLQAPDDERDRSVFLWVYPRFKFDTRPVFTSRFLLLL